MGVFMFGFINGVLDILKVTKAEGYSEISPTEAVSLLNKDSDALVLDVRSPVEFKGPMGHIKGSKLIPVEYLWARVDELSDFKNKNVFIICQSDHKGRIACITLARSGFANVYNVISGMSGVNQVPGAPVAY
jgi:phage shock protein E